MAKLRSVNTHFWTDSYIIDLDPIEKLLFLYLITNPLTTMAGAYEISLRQIAFDTGIDKEMVMKMIGRFEKHGKLVYRSGWIVLRNFIKHQHLNTNMRKGVDAVLATSPEWVKETVLNPLKGFQTLREKELEVERELEVEKEVEPAAMPPTPTPENKFVLAFKKAFPSYLLTVPQLEAIEDGVDDLSAWEKAVKYWAENNYRPQSIGKLVECYVEIREGRHKLVTGKESKRPSQLDAGRSDPVVVLDEGFCPKCKRGECYEHGKVRQEAA